MHIRRGSCGKALTRKLKTGTVFCRLCQPFCADCARVGRPQAQLRACKTAHPAYHQTRTQMTCWQGLSDPLMVSRATPIKQGLTTLIQHDASIIPVPPIDNGDMTDASVSMMPSARLCQTCCVSYAGNKHIRRCVQATHKFVRAVADASMKRDGTVPLCPFSPLAPCGPGVPGLP